MVNPQAFLWRHYLELKLKALMPDLRDFPDGPAGLPPSGRLGHGHARILDLGAYSGDMGTKCGGDGYVSGVSGAGERI